MATRQVMNISKVTKCHVVSSGADEGSCKYEEATAYEAGTMVLYDGTFFCAVVDIEAMDTDTPLEAADKWAFVPLIPN